MLSKSLYNRELVVIHDELHYEVSRVLGQPIILIHNETGQPLASIHYHIPHVENCMLTHTKTENSFRAISSFPHSVGAGKEAQKEQDLGALLITNMLFDEPIGFEVQDYTQEPLVVPEGKTYMYKLQKHTRNIKCRITSFLGHEFDQAIWTRKQLICRPRIPLKPDQHVPQQMAHPAFLGGDGNMVKAMQMLQQSSSSSSSSPPSRGELEEEHFFAHGCPWFTIQQSFVEKLVIPPNMSKMFTLKKSLTLLEECIINKNTLLLKRCKGQYEHDGDCVICLDGLPDCTIYPCGHKCAHFDCMSGMEESKCPMCRANVQNLVMMNK